MDNLCSLTEGLFSTLSIHKWGSVLGVFFGGDTRSLDNGTYRLTWA